MNTLKDQAAENLIAVRRNVPLIHNITNFVVMNVTANALLAIGASPMMAHAPEEAAALADLAGALVLNIGTLTREWVPTMILAGQAAATRGKPVVFDPVGAGTTRFRTDTARKILKEAAVKIVRGNASEVHALSDVESDSFPGGKGVDAVHSMEAVLPGAMRLADRTGVTLAVTGPIDVVTDGFRQVRVANGHPLMQRVTGTGCTASALIAAFAAVDSDAFTAAATALAVFGLAGEMAAAGANGPGSFMVNLMDVLYAMTPEAVRIGVRIEEA
ncbi:MULTISPECIES: hydroxyethylthiazole kinase [Desulfococcus]|jgi:hydroxyethylthiazole kinase|uniref:Hydroxyethylthiazole kinase n=2 Tax=Desulfococcus multivorans TaxID=897 RepID=S7V4V9_DESML|nr:hydroxyethylthiazole kinase [Desulfococcus multivorans]AOY60627.1 ThiM: hydroxyethylthiazole kinase [Desulfococcus multivorans]AQV02717.1 hydroxyethylthiazole kinase [Desulfococcus multivorans]EPR39663.1 Hydroxyethylthiazole kinase [Desulfococcus multivorans DSM 2059]MDX9819439.1 hydroxyethylthiazole kinase [Desulfococcus multivorans]SKA03511.1 hydroxyethylthiazole kinase [Desulfococcus multivorans DSM 2059]